MDWLARKIGWIGWREKNEMDGWNCWQKNWKRETWDGLAGEKKGMDWLARQFDEREEFVGSAHGWIQPTTSNQPNALRGVRQP